SLRSHGAALAQGGPRSRIAPRVDPRTGRGGTQAQTARDEEEKVMAHVQHRCTRCRRNVPPGARACPGCGSKNARWIARYLGADGRERTESFAHKVDAENHL